MKYLIWKGQKKLIGLMNEPKRFHRTFCLVRIIRIF